MLSDIEIARACKIQPITQIARAAGIDDALLEPYGKYKAKVDYLKLQAKPMHGKLILVTAINPTPAGEGKTTVSIGLADAMRRQGKNVCLTLREPSLGPVFGVKGGAAGGGYAQVVPMEDINLHFTGDLHAITSANNLLAALVDNHVQQGNVLGIDPRRISFKRCMDMNDRALRQIIVGLGGKPNGMPREDGFDITTASEIMAILCLADDIADLKTRLGRIVVGHTYANTPVTASDLNAQGAMAALLRDAIRPNLVQTLEGTPALVHGGPFANIAHGCNTVVATKTALRLADYTVTEAGFGADLGAEKFIDIKCRMAGIKPSCIVLVATIRALKSHGGVAKADLSTENLTALDKGLGNLRRHLRNIREVWGVEPVVALNRFVSDTQAEIDLVIKASAELGASVALCDVWAKGGAGGLELATQVAARCEDSNLSRFSLTYPDDMPIKDKITAVARRIYGAAEVAFTATALRTIRTIESECGSALPVCIAKTQYSFSDDPKKVGAPEGFTFTIRDVRLSAGAGFVVALCGDIMTMPGLPRVPAADGIDVDADGNITGLF